VAVVDNFIPDHRNTWKKNKYHRLDFLSASSFQPYKCLW